MCGIAGYIGKSPISNKQVLDTINVMKNRGPDFQDFICFSNAGHFVTLIHSRLSIIDLDSRSNQPFIRKHCILVFNGEIYNYIEIRKELESLGAVFKTNSDTEVLIQSYLYFGENCVNKFEGMWSFALYDKIKNKLFLSRDRFAEKPLYYHETASGFYFSSEVKAIKKLCGKNLTVNNNQLFRYLVNGHKSLYKTSETFYDEIKEVDYASNLIIENTEIKTYKYWKPSYTPKNISESDAIDGIKHYLKKSLKLRLRSDVPLAFCLSGGVDSASLVSLAAKEFNYDVSSFSIIDSDKRYDEYENIMSTVNDIGCKSFKVKLDSKADNISRLENLVKYHDAPVATISYFVHSMLSEAIASKGFKISISGTAADEIFTGYYDHFNLHLYNVRNDKDFESYLNDWKKFPLKYIRHPYFKKHDLYFNNPMLREHIYLNSNKFLEYLNIPFKENFTESNYTSSLLRNRMINELFHEVVRVILHEDDLNSMYYSLENRSPFLDKELFEFVYSIPSKLLIKNGYAKYLLRESMAGVLNDKVRLDREKKGFNASINSIIDFNNKNHIEYLLDDSKVFDFVNKEKIETLLKRKEYSNSFKKFIFNFINVKIFLS
jgi:asparagine synthase (glutamine-hydrolysing)